MLPNEVDVAVSSSTPLLKNFCKSRVVRQDRGWFIGRGDALVIESFQSVHALVEGRLLDPIKISQIYNLVQAPCTGGLRLQG